MIAGMVLLAGLSLTGCKLIDQTTFAPAPEAKPAQVALPKLDQRTPLVTIGYDQPNPQYQAMLGYAVHAAEARDAAVQYDVFAVVPAKGTPTQQIAGRRRGAAGRGRGDARRSWRWGCRRRASISACAPTRASVPTRCASTSAEERPPAAAVPAAPGPGAAGPGAGPGAWGCCC